LLLRRISSAFVLLVFHVRKKQFGLLGSLVWIGFVLLFSVAPPVISSAFLKEFETCSVVSSDYFFRLFSFSVTSPDISSAFRVVYVSKWGSGFLGVGILVCQAVKGYSNKW
jgi:hypothetical protein